MDREHGIKFIKIVLITSLLYTVFILLAHHVTREYAFIKGEEKLNDILLYQKALHKYIEEVQKPLFYQLKDELKLEKDYFEPRVLSFTFIARNVHQFNNIFREEAGIPTLHYKLASSNPRNELNRANEIEEELLKKVNSEKLQKFKSIHKHGEDTYLLYVLPIAPNKKSCMRCHGSPKDAPQNLINLYGDKNGFNEDIGRIRALISFDLNLQREIDDADLIFWVLSLFALFTLLTILSLAYIHLKRLSEKNQELKKMATVDTLTGAYNRRKFHDVVDTKFKNKLEALSVIIFDIDFFKRVNDNYGHDIGDEVLKAIAEVVVSIIDKERELFIRWGGEEFVILTDRDFQEVVAIATKLREIVEKRECPKSLKITISLGVAKAIKEEQTIKSMIKRADDALYLAKDSGRNRVVIDSVSKEE